jgi:hypothetical protein
MTSPMPRRKPDRFKSPFAPVMSARSNKNRVIETTLAKYLASLAKNDPMAIRLRRFIRDLRTLTKAAPRTTTLHFAIRGNSTIFWAHEAALSPRMEVSVTLPTSATFHSMRNAMT